MKDFIRNILTNLTELFSPIIDVLDWSKIDRKIFVINYSRFIILYIVSYLLKYSNDPVASVFGSLLKGIIFKLYLLPEMLLCAVLLNGVFNILSLIGREIKIYKALSFIDFFLVEFHGLNIGFYMPVIKLVYPSVGEEESEEDKDNKEDKEKK